MTMEQSIQIETGAQLLARLMKRPSLKGLEKVLFSTHGPRHNEVIEISGDLSSGKTLLITQLLVKCILPKNYKDCYLNGLDAGAILINTDHHFQISMLVNLMIRFIQDVITFKKLGRKVLDDETVRSIIEDSLSNLTVVNCYDSSQFLLGLESLQTILSNDDKIATVIVDSVSSYYWQDRDNGGIWSMDGYLKNCLKLMQKYTFHHKIVLLYTRPSEFESRGKETVDCATLPEEEKVNYKIKLRRLEKTSEFTAIVESATDKRSISYSISDNGIEWRMNESEEQN